MARIDERYLRPLFKIGPGYVLSTGALLALVAWAIYAYSFQLKIGLAITGMNTPTSWGFYIVNFVFFVGLSAGGIIIASLVHAFGIQRFRSVARIAELMAISCLILATIFIMLDLGRPDRFYHLFLYGRFASPLIWDVIVITLYLLVGMAYGYFGTRADLVRCMALIPHRRGLFQLLALGYTDLSERAIRRDRKILKGLAIVGLPLAVALHSVTAWILGLVKAHPGWHSALLAPLFVISATVSGLALLIVSVVFSKRVLKVEIEEEVIKDLGKLLTLSIPVLGYFLFAELLTVTYAKEPAGLHVFQEMMFGPYAPFFWGNLILGLLSPLVVLAKPRPKLVVGVGLAAGLVIALAVVKLQIKVPFLLNYVFPYLLGFSLPAWLEYLLLWLFGLLLPLILLLDERRRVDTRIGIAAALVVLGILAERWNIVIAPLLGHAHLPYAPGGYTPTPLELSLVIGVYALGALFFAIAAKLLPLVELEEEAGI
ncbi:MAG: polysulfide reductase NrfD [candidate division NC10 bacterium]|nr:polysulfide reductase NrfD [candidate division NC10 bacterium]